MKRQIVVLEVWYEEDGDGNECQPPNEWDWADLAGEYHVECVACGPLTVEVEHP